jgi:hypothetical protein
MTHMNALVCKPAAARRVAGRSGRTVRVQAKADRELYYPGAKPPAYLDGSLGTCHATHSALGQLPASRAEPGRAGSKATSPKQSCSTPHWLFPRIFLLSATANRCLPCPTQAASCAPLCPASPCCLTESADTPPDCALPYRCTALLRPLQLATTVRECVPPGCLQTQRPRCCFADLCPLVLSFPCASRL